MHTKPKHNYLSNFCQLTSRVPRCIIPRHSFVGFTKDKIERISTKFVPTDSLDPFRLPSFCPAFKTQGYIPTIPTEIKKLISASEIKQCLFDCIPTFLMKLCFNELGPIIQILSIAVFLKEFLPLSFKQALICLASCQKSIDDLNNLRLISNLNFIFEILEKDLGIYFVSKIINVQ